MARPVMIQPVETNTTGINMLVYGDNGTGKTALAGTGERTLILDADNGTESAAMRGSKADKWPISGWSDIDEAFEYLRHENHGYRWVWLDTISIWQEKSLESIMEELVQLKSNRKIWAADKGEYQQNMLRIKSFIRHMTAAPFNFGITAHTWRGIDEVDEEEFKGPWIRGKGMVSTIAGYMSVVAYLERSEKDPKNRWLRTQSFDDHNFIKDRFDAIGGDKGKLLNPTIPKIEKLIEDARSKVTSSEAKSADDKPKKKTKKGTK